MKNSKVTVFYNNINGFQSKSESLSEIIRKLKPEIIGICETKAAPKNTLRRDFKDYDVVTKQIKKGKGGLLCGIKKKVGFQSVLEVTTVKNDNILTVKVVFTNVNMRIVLAYGPQENESSELREDFFRDLSIEIEASKVNGDKLLLMGDLNSKIKYEDDKIISLTNNGKHLEDIVAKYNLKVLNFSEKCSGKWTHVIRKSNVKSVIDYIIVDEEVNNTVDEIVIDEDCLHTPFRVVRQNQVEKPHYADHNSIITTLDFESYHTKEEAVQDEEINMESWIFSEEGWKKFNELTSLNPCQISEWKDSNDEYTSLEKYIKNTLDRCFKRRSAPQKNSLVHTSAEERRNYKVIRQFKKLGKVQRKVANIYIKIIKENNLNRAGEIRSEKVRKSLEQLSRDDRLSPNAFWKLKKNLNLNTEVGTSVILKNGCEVFGESAIKEAYQNEFIHRLRKRTINEDLQVYEKQTNAICDLYVKEGMINHEKIQFSENKLIKVIQKLKRNKAPGPDGLPAEVFIHAGGELIKSIVGMFNNIKRNSTVPNKWNMVKIKTLYKNKGSPKDLENYRGVFLTPTIAKLCERYLMRESGENIENISKFQGGSRPNRSASDQLFLVRACVDHARYLKIIIFLTLYDFKQCFDSMWLEDSLISLKEIGIGEEILTIIKKLNETADIVVNTPVGNCREFTAYNIVKQGTVLGPLLCSASTAECCTEHIRGGVTIGSANIRSLAYVDDIIDINEGVEEATISHETVIKFTSKKRLEISWKKCAVIPINSRKNSEMPVLYVDGKPIKIETSAKYLGDIINSKGTHADMVEDRVKRGDSCAANMFSIVQNITFGCHSIETLLMLYDSLFLATVIYNSQSWSVLSNTETRELKTCQMRLLKRILKAPKAAPNAIVLLELGVLPLEFEIYRKKLMFLQHILKLDQNDPVRQVYEEQRKYNSESNWTNEVERIKKQINLEVDDQYVSEISKTVWKTTVNKSVRKSAVRILNSECLKLKKVTRQYTELKTKEYLYKLSAEDARTAFGYRSGTLDIKCHKSYMYSDLRCRACGEDKEDTNHIVNHCRVMNKNYQSNTDIETEEVNTIAEVVKTLNSFTQTYL